MSYKANKVMSYKVNKALYPNQRSTKDHLAIFEQLMKNYLAGWKRGIIFVLSFSILLILLPSSPLNAQKANQVHPNKANHPQSEKANHVQKENANQNKTKKANHIPANTTTQTKKASQTKKAFHGQSEKAPHTQTTHTESPHTQVPNTESSHTQTLISQTTQVLHTQTTQAPHTQASNLQTTQIQTNSPIAPADKESSASASSTSIYRLKIGLPVSLQGQEITIRPGQIYNLREGRKTSWEEMVADLEQVKYIFVGETHTSFPIHEIQSKVIQSLVERGSLVGVCMEMLPVTIQEKLTKWQLGILTEDEFLREAKWYVYWGYNFGYYRPILNLIKNYHLPFYGVNVPREWITQVRMKGREALGETEKNYIPPLDLSHKEHRLLIQAMFDSMGFPHQMKDQAKEKAFEAFYRAQVAWDQTMAFHTWQAAKKEDAKERSANGIGSIEKRTEEKPPKQKSPVTKSPGQKRPGVRVTTTPAEIELREAKEEETKIEAKRDAIKMVVLAGSGHFLYKLGINARLRELDNRPSRTIIALEIPKEEGKMTISRTLADYVVGLHQEERPRWPLIGLSIKKVKGLANLVVSRNPINGVAKEAGLQKGDVILEVDNLHFEDENELLIYLAQKQYGDEVQMVVLRDGETHPLTLKF